MITHIYEPGSPGFLRLGPSFTTGTPTPKITLFAGELSGPFTGLHIGLSHSIEMAQARQLKPRKTGLEAVGLNRKHVSRWSPRRKRRGYNRLRGKGS